MSTRSAIGIMRGDSCHAVYCHFDGYLKGVGEILQNHYTDVNKVNQLIALGDLSVLGHDIGVQHDFESRESKLDCTFYGRDRGETGAVPRNYLSYIEFYQEMSASGCEYFYIMKDGVWFYSTYKQKALKELNISLQGLK